MTYTVTGIEAGGLGGAKGTVTLPGNRYLDQPLGI